MTRYNTNLAAEFYVLSTLHRIGVDASLTLGNKKAVDIFIIHQNKRVVTIDVKGVASRYDWPADNINTTERKNHFYVLVCFEGKIDDPKQLPSVWIIPSTRIKHFIKEYETRRVVSRAIVKKDGDNYINAWSLLETKEGR